MFLFLLLYGFLAGTTIMFYPGDGILVLFYLWLLDVFLSHIFSIIFFPSKFFDVIGFVLF
jgi:hypothetical protein